MIDVAALFRRRSWLIAVAALLGWTSACWTSASHAQPARPALAYLGVATCRNCHSKETTTSPAAFQREGSLSPFCELVQARTWQESDKHSQSFQLLVDTPTKRALVNRILGFELTSVLTRDDQGSFDGLLAPQN